MKIRSKESKLDIRGYINVRAWDEDLSKVGWNERGVKWVKLVPTLKRGFLELNRRGDGKSNRDEWYIDAVINIFYCVSFLLYPTCTYRHITPLFFAQQLYNREQKLNSTANEQYTIINIIQIRSNIACFPLEASTYLFIYFFLFFSYPSIFSHHLKILIDRHEYNLTVEIRS